MRHIKYSGNIFLDNEHHPLQLHKGVTGMSIRTGAALVALLAPVMIAQGATQKRTIDETAISAPTSERNGGMIAFLSDRTAGVHELYVMPIPDGSDTNTMEVRLLGPAGDGFCVGPSWSPDGRHIAYAKTVPDKHGKLDNHGPFEVWVTALDGNKTLLCANMGDEFRALPWPTPSWSPDGARLAFVTAHENDKGELMSTVHMVTADGKGIQWSHPLPWLALDVIWSPAGDTLLLVAHDEKRGPSVHLLSIADKALTRVQRNAQAADWSPDGSELVVVPTRPAKVLIIKPGKGLRTIARIKKRIPLAARWSPSGKHIVVGTSNSSDSMKIVALHLVAVETGTITTVAERDGELIYRPSWSPDGKHLLYTTTDPSRPRQGRIAHADMWIYDLASGETHQITSGNFHDSMGVWSPIIGD